MREPITLYKTESLALGFKCIEKSLMLLPLGLSEDDLNDFMNILGKVAEINGINDMKFKHSSTEGYWEDYYWAKKIDDESVRYMKLDESKLRNRQKYRSRIEKDAEEVESDTPEDLIKGVIERVATFIDEARVIKKANENPTEDVIQDEESKRQAVGLTRKIFNETALIYRSYLIDVYISGTPNRTWNSREKELVRRI